MKRYRSPKICEVVEAYNEVKAIGLWNVKLGNTGILVSTEEDSLLLKKQVGAGNY